MREGVSSGVSKGRDRRQSPPVSPVFQWARRDSNPHGPSGPRDFKTLGPVRTTTQILGFQAPPAVACGQACGRPAFLRSRLPGLTCAQISRSRMLSAGGGRPATALDRYLYHVVQSRHEQATHPPPGRRIRLRRRIPGDPRAARTDPAAGGRRRRPVPQYHGPDRGRPPVALAQDRLAHHRRRRNEPRRLPKEFYEIVENGLTPG